MVRITPRMLDKHHTEEIYYNDTNSRMRRILVSYCMISNFRHEVYDNCGLLGDYAASTGKSLSTFRDNLSVPSLKAKNPKTKTGKPSTAFIQGVTGGTDQTSGGCSLC